MAKFKQTDAKSWEGGFKEGRRKTFEEFEKLVKKHFYFKAKDIHPPFKEMILPISSIPRLDRFEKELNKLKELKHE